MPITSVDPQTPLDGRIRRVALIAISAITAVVAVVAVGAWRYREHFLTVYAIRNFSNQVVAVPVTSMMAQERPLGWHFVRIESLRMSLPPWLATEAKRDFKDGFVLLTSPNAELAITLPVRDERAANEFRQMTDALFPGKSPSRKQLTGSLYALDAADFRWSMSAEEAKNHRSKVGLAWILRTRTAKSVETRFDDSIEGLLLVQGQGQAIFEFETADGEFGGFIIFHNRAADLDLDWIRMVCQSLTVDKAAIRSARERARGLVESIESLPEEEPEKGR